MERLKNITIIFVLAVGMLNCIALAKRASVRLQEGLYAEEVDGDLDAAIRIYEQVINDSSAQRSHVAQAMYRQGMCYLKKRDEQQAKAIFGQLVAKFSDQTKIIDKVKPMLEELSNADPAALMPPETLIYIETGSPGRQIETILKMLKGTPFENPLAAIGAGKKPAGQKSPGDIMAALLNPAMMAEFKKIRGMAIGITEIKMSNPSAIMVLYPGKSDALRGLILAGLGMVGTPGEPIEGMQTMTIAGTAGAAHDDNVVIVAQPREQLTWCVKQYKGITNEPTLASNNKSFAKISKKERQENALTIWANVDEAFAELSKMFPQDKIPAHIRIADGFVDFRNIDDLLSFFSIQESGIASETNIALKNGHRCLAYNMIRTPNLTRPGFEAVPAEAVALVSIALGEVGSAPIVSKKIENLTGLDIGREIFANIEQITLFALTPGSASAQSNTAIPPIATNLGLAITSHNPQQTRQILTQLLTVANLISGQSVSEQPERGISKYQIGLVNNQKLYCYMNQMNKTTVLSLNPDVAETSVSAINKRRSVYTAGPLKETINNLSPTTSKLVLVNVGGAIRVADAYLNATYDNPLNPVHKTLAQLAQACDKTSVQLRTDERINNFNVHKSVDQLPPLDNVFPLLMQLSKADVTAKAKATKPQPRDGATVGLTTVSKLSWKPGANAASHKVYFGTRIDELQLLAEVSKPDDVQLPELEENARYYWRVDEVWDDGTIITGDVWNFTIGKLVGWWKFDETEGGNASDSSSNNNVGTLVGNPQWQPTGGQIGGALWFDGVDDYVNCGNDKSLDITDQITLAAWVKMNDAGNSEFNPFVTKGDRTYGLKQHSQNTLEFVIYDGTWRVTHYPVDNSFNGVWHHLAGTYDGSNLKLYIDGKLEVTTAHAGSIASSAANLNIATNSEESGRFYNGAIDDLRIYNYALSEGEITALYNKGKER